MAGRDRVPPQRRLDPAISVIRPTPGPDVTNWSLLKSKGLPAVAHWQRDSFFHPAVPFHSDAWNSNAPRTYHSLLCFIHWTSHCSQVSADLWIQGGFRVHFHQFWAMYHIVDFGVPNTVSLVMSSTCPEQKFPSASCRQAHGWERIWR
jgi:hypothetical protein